MSVRKIVILTTGQPSTNPRMVKEVEALVTNGYQVKVFYSYWAAWAQNYDQSILKQYPGIFKEVGGNPLTAGKVYLLTRVLHKLMRMGASKIPALKKYALARTALALQLAAARERADLYIAHNLGALPAAALAAKKWMASLGFDAEDYHRGEWAKEDPYYKAVCFVEESYIPGCTYVTAASPLISKAYRALFPGLPVTTVNNVFGKRYLQPYRESDNKNLSLFWFSQTVGANRGLEIVVQALNQLHDYNITLCILGDASGAYRSKLMQLSRKPQAITFMQPVSSDKIFSIAAQFDIGLSTEIPCCANREVCLVNKLFSYLLAGNCIVASDTPAQQEFLNTCQGIGMLYKNADAGHLAEVLSKLYNDRPLLNTYKKNALAIAGATLNWEEESKKFLTIIHTVLEEDRKTKL